MTLVTARKIGLYLLVVGVLYSVISFPDRSGEFAQLVFTALAGAVDALFAPLR
ncbi:hypothetical protein [Streptomyces sp. NBRC 109706]|uniref:hypothetical protein n=1 Tax=Streptomyces sp. NBRC 109706 TaxID=1550035 RepID=UPI000B0BA0F6|nr:hypothetical protein [Streptomyces sp. NBRC 109706]